MRSGLGVLVTGLVTGWMGIVLAPLGHVQAAGPLQRAAGASPASVTAQRAILDRYCVTCHNERTLTAGLALDTLHLDEVGDEAETWEKVVRKLQAGVMPPAGRPRPDTASYDGLASWLETELDRASAADPNPGRTEPFHRLNRTEYQNAIPRLAGAGDRRLVAPPDRRCELRLRQYGGCAEDVPGRCWSAICQPRRRSAGWLPALLRRFRTSTRFGSARTSRRTIA